MKRRILLFIFGYILAYALGAYANNTYNILTCLPNETIRIIIVIILGGTVLGILFNGIIETLLEE